MSLINYLHGQEFWHRTPTTIPNPCESQPHKGHLTSKLKYKWFPSILLCTHLIFPFHILPSPVYPTGFSFCFFPGFLTIFTLTVIFSIFRSRDPPLPVYPRQVCSIDPIRLLACSSMLFIFWGLVIGKVVNIVQVLFLISLINFSWFLLVTERYFRQSTHFISLE